MRDTRVGDWVTNLDIYQNQEEAMWNMSWSASKERWV